MAQRRFRIPCSVLTVTAIVLAMLPIEVHATGESPLITQGFLGNSVPVGQWDLPGANGACLSAGPTGSASSVPVCVSHPDASGSGSLQLTNNGTSQTGAVFYSASLPTSQGLDITFDTYQYNGSGADGIAFTLAAADPANPEPPSIVGPPGSSLGYVGTTAQNGISDGYLGIGFDAYGGFESSNLQASACATLPGLMVGAAYSESVTTRGPGNGKVGYCSLASTASTYMQPGAGTGAGNLGTGNTVDNPTATSRIPNPTPVVVPVEVAINPSGADTLTSSNLLVPANSWIVAFTPLGGGAQQTQTGLLPTTATSPALATFPTSWINQTTKIPYQLTFGWTASTGGANEFHQINNVVAQSLLGPVPTLTLGTTDNENGLMVAGNIAQLTLSPGTSASGGAEANQLTVTETLPADMTPGTATSPSDWSCGTAGQVVTCTYAPGSAITPGTALPDITIPVSLALGLSGSVSTSGGISSTDGLPGTSAHPMSVSAFTASATPASQSYAQAVTYSSTLPSSATGSVVFTTGATALCTAALPALSCTGATAPAGVDSVTAAYSGDADFASQTVTTSVTITKVGVTFIETASPASVGFGTTDTLSDSGLPSDATGTVTFASGSTTLCLATLPLTNCLTSASLAINTYVVTATYGGDGNYTDTTATGANFAVVKGDTSFTEAAAPASVAFGTADTLSESGLPTGAGGTVTFASGGATLCTATLPTASCNTSTSLALNSYAVTATYSGDGNYNGFTANGASFTVTILNTTFTESAAPATIAYGAQDTLSVAGIPGAATGTVTFTSGGATLCTATLPAATSCQTSPTLAPGAYTVLATYAGDTDYNGSSATGASFTVTKASTSMTEGASPASIPFGDQDTLSIAGLTAAATGTLTFTSGGSTLCTALLPLISCQTDPTLAAGSYTVTATYGGDTNHNGTSATGAGFTVTMATPSFTESASPASIGYGSPDTLSVSGLSSTAGGTVTFISGIGTLCVATLPTASCATSATLAQGTYGVLARYSGDPNNNSATAAGASFMVVKATISFIESASPATVAFGTADTLSESGISAGATGTVVFFYSGGLLCTVTLPTASCQTRTTLAPATYAVTAAYSGDANYDGQLETGAGFTVTQASTSMTESSSPASIAYGAQDTLSVTGLLGDATGTITFTSGGATLCTALLPASSCQTSATLPPGLYDVTATYPGDAGYVGTTAAAAAFTVTRAATSMTESASPASISIGGADTLTVTGLAAGATGTVTFSAGGVTLCVLTLPTSVGCPTSPSLGLGVYNVTATYPGDADFAGASSTGASFMVVQTATSITESAALASVPYGTADTLSVTGLPAGVTGAVTFATTHETLCIATLPAVSCRTSASLDVATYDVTATYSGDADDTGALSTGAAFAVVRAATSMTVSVSPSTIQSGAALTPSVAGLPVNATGSVTFTIGDVVLCTATLPAITCNGIANLVSGTYAVRATYSGDDNFTGSTAIGVGAVGTFTVLATPLASTPIPGTGAGVLGWRFVFGALLLLAGTTVAAASGLRSRRPQPD